MAGRSVHDSTSPAAHCGGAWVADVSGRNGLRRRPAGGRAGWVVCKPRVSGAGTGGLYTLFQNDNLLGLFPGTPSWSPNFDPNGQQIMKGASIRADVTPEYLVVGYIIGARVAAVMLAGGVVSWLVVMPAIVFFGKHLAAPVYPGVVPISQMTPSDLWSTYVRPMGAGAVAASGLITLLRTA